MADIVLDTHTAIWYFANSPDISVLATQTIDNAVANGDTTILATISIVEIIYLIDKKKLVLPTLSSLIKHLKMPNTASSRRI